MGKQIQIPRIERGIAKPITPFERGGLVSAWPSKGPNTYQEVGREILNDGNGLRLQTGYETSLLVSSACDSEEPEFQDLKDKMNKAMLWVYHVNFWLPEKDENSGVYSVHDSKSLGRDMNFNQEELEEMLRGGEIYQGVRYNSDKGVAFAPRGTITFGKQNWDMFRKNGLNIAIFSSEGAEDLANLGEKNFRSGYVFGVSNNQKIEKRLSVLHGDWKFGGRLSVVGEWVDGGGGHAFGVCAPEKSE